MTVWSHSPWVKPLLPFLDIDVIRERSRLAPVPAQGLSSMPLEAAAETLEAALKSIYVPTYQGCVIIQRLIERVIGHFVLNYPDTKTFLARIYQENELDQDGDADDKYDAYRNLSELCGSPIAKDGSTRDCRPICLTGPAGCGKSELLAALARALPSNLVTDRVSGHSTFPIRGHYGLRVKETTSVVEILKPMLQEHCISTPDKISLSKLKAACKANLYMNGIALLSVDEFQFFTQSAEANTAVTKALLFLSYLGVPLVYVANYSLCHRLTKRPQQDRQRLLADPMVLLPDAPGSEDWVEYIGECVRVSAGHLSINMSGDADEIHKYSAGLKRLVPHLIKIAFILTEGKRPINIDDIRHAYQSTAYTSNRQDVEVLVTQSITGKREGKDDLWCPFSLPKNAQISFTEKSQSQRAAQVAIAAAISSLSSEEKKNLNGRLRDNVTAANGKATNVVKLRKNKATADSLLAGAKLFSEKIMKK